MKKILSVFVIASVLLMMVPGILAASTGIGIGVDIETEQFQPNVWMCDDRVVFDDATEPGRITLDGEEMFERTSNYAFEGEQITWRVLVHDKNGVEKIQDVFGTVGDVQGAGNDVEVNCELIELLDDPTDIDASCNARIGQADLEDVFFDETAAYYQCTLTVETPDSMYGEYWITVEALDLDGLSGTMAENEYWFLNPVIALSIDGDLVFEEVTPGTLSYSETLLVGNDADDGSGVQMDMFISGTDFYDSSSFETACENPFTGVRTNQLILGNGDSFCDDADPFCYFATNGAYDTTQDARSDAEGYVGIGYGVGFNDPNPFYGAANGDVTGYEIIQALQVGPYFPGNILQPGAEHAVTFRLNMPEPCNGNFDTGDISFWGEAI